MQQLQSRGKESSRERYASVFKSPSFDGLRNKKLLETTTDDFFAVFKDGKVSIVYFLKRLHNFALSLGWIALPGVAPYLLPKYEPKDGRGLTLAEHHSILASEKKAEWKLFLELLWETGAAQSDAANFKAEDVDWQSRTITYFRAKTGCGRSSPSARHWKRRCSSGPRPVRFSRSCPRCQKATGQAVSAVAVTRPECLA